MLLIRRLNSSVWCRYLQVNRHTLDYPRQLFGYAQNIADGMEYLTQVSS